jgi:hypothetical protein
MSVTLDSRSGHHSSIFIAIPVGNPPTHLFIFISDVFDRGRGHEVPGEDPTLSAVYSINFVRAMQWSDESKYLRVSANCKVIFIFRPIVVNFYLFADDLFLYRRRMQAIRLSNGEGWIASISMR